MEEEEKSIVETKYLEEEAKLQQAIEIEKKRNKLIKLKEELRREKKKNKKPGILDIIAKNFGGGAGDNDFGF